MAEKVKIVGGDLDGSQLENAASEATLLLLKEAMNKLANIKNVSANNATRDISRLGDSAGDTADEIDSLGGAFSVLGGPLKLVTGGFKLLYGGIGSLLGAVDAGANSLIKFSANMIDSQPNITDFTEAIAESKLNILGLGTAIDAATRILYGNYTTFQDLAKSGFQLGSQVSQLTGDITANRLTLQEFSRIATENSENFAMFGNATVGLNKFLKMNSSAFKVNRDILQNWGVTFSEQGELFADFLGQNAYAIRRGTRTQAEVTALSADYATTLLKLSGLTGKTLKQMQEDMGKQNLNNAFTSFLDTLPVDEAAKIKAMILSQQQQFGQDAADLAMAQVMGQAPLTEGSQRLSALMPDLVGNIENQIDAAKNSGVSLDTYSSDILVQNQKTAEANLELINQLGQVGFALDAQGNSLGTVIQELIGNLRRTSGAFEQTNVELDPTAEAIATFEDVVSDLRATMGGWFTAFFNDPDVQSGLTKMTTWLREFDPTKYNPFDEAGRQNIYDSFWKGIENVSTAISDWWNGPQGQKIEETLTFYFERLMFRLMEALNNVPGLNLMVDNDTIEKDRIRLGLGSEGETNLFIREQERKVASLRAELSSLRTEQDAYMSSNDPYALDKSADISLRESELTETITLLSEIAELQARQARQTANTAEVVPPTVVGTPTPVGPPYATGTDGFENFGSGTQAVLHNSEAVIPRNTLAGDMLNKFFGNDWNKLTSSPPTTNDQQKQSAQSQDTTGKYIMQLNSTMLLVLEELRKGNNLEKRTLNSVKGLSGDMFRGM